MSDYSASARALHWAALSSPALNELAFDIEKALFLGSAPRPDKERYVFVQGLARAGTTILMREIYNTRQFVSLTYADMPFLMCCNVWSAVTKRSPGRVTAKERAHGDGISVDAHSPEALDEVFWRVFCGQDYIRKDCLQVHTPNSEILNQFGDYIRLILRRANGTRYLSKNNNNILRLPTLIKRFPDSVFLIPMRSPLQQASSLLRQHLRFNRSDDYTQRYMTWLGHHEFGATHRPFGFPDAKCSSASGPQSLSYWLETWIACYGYLDQLIGNRVESAFFIPYESLCQDPAVWQAISKRLDVACSNTSAFRLGESTDDPVDSPYLGRANQLYADITRRALDRLLT